MSKKNIIVLVIAGSILLGVAIYFIFHHSQPDTPVVTLDDKIKQAIDSATAPLKRENDSLIISNGQLEQLIGVETNETDSLIAKIEAGKIIIQQIKNKYNEKISAAKYYNHASRNSFLTNRYHY